MASSNTNGTIFTVGLVAIGAFVAYKLFGKRSTQASTQPGSVPGEAYYPPSQSQDSGLGSILSALLNALGGNKFSGGISGGGGGGGGKNPSTAGTGYGDSGYTDQYGASVDALAAAATNDDINTFEPLGYPDVSGDESLFQIDPVDNSAENSAFLSSLATDLAPAGAFVDSSDDGSANSVTAFNNGLSLDGSSLLNPITSSGLDDNDFQPFDLGGGFDDNDSGDDGE